MSPWVNSEDPSQLYTWTDRGTNEAKNISDYVFNGTLTSLDPDRKIGNFTLETSFGAKIGDVDLGGLFDAVEFASFQNFHIDRVHINHLSAKGAGLVASGMKKNSSAGTVSCYNVVTNANCSIHGSQNCGGFIGYVRNGSSYSFENCINNATVNCSAANIGGFIGSGTVGSNRTFTFINCTNNGAITGSLSVGGFGGYIVLGSDTVVATSCVNNGVIKSTSEVRLGAFFGSYEVVPSDSSLNNIDVTNTQSLIGPSSAYSSADGWTIKNHAKELYTASNQDPEQTSLPIPIKFLNVNGNPGSTIAEYREAFLQSADIANVSSGLSWANNQLLIEYENEQVDKVVVSVNLGPTYTFITANNNYGDASGSDPIQTYEFDSIESVNVPIILRFGWFLPSSAQAVPNDHYSTEHWTPYLLDYSLKDTAGYEPGLHCDSDGWYYLHEHTGGSETYTAFSNYWLNFTYTVNFYHGDDKIATGVIQSTESVTTSLLIKYVPANG